MATKPNARKLKQKSQRNGSAAKYGKPKIRRKSVTDKQQELRAMTQATGELLTAADKAIQSLEADLQSREEQLRAAHEKLHQVEAGDEDFAQQLMDALKGPIQGLKERLEKRRAAQAAASPLPDGNAS